nr:stromal 70 kDa heat shock-related protein, chloroplastic-like isoform X2 [Erigeron canadensis]
MSDPVKIIQVQRMVNGAVKFVKEDKEKRDAIDTKNHADLVVYQTEKRLRERETMPPSLLPARHYGSQTSVRVAETAMTNTSKTAFGATIILDDALNNWHRKNLQDCRKCTRDICIC